MTGHRALRTVLTGSALAALAVACGGGVTPVAKPTPAPTPAPASSTSSTTTGSPSPSPTASSAKPTATSTLPASLLGRVITRIPTTRHIAALTFDAGGNGDGVASVLATLRRENVPATFFMTGKFAAQFPTYARQLAAAGVVGDHTVTHPHLTTLSDEKVRDEVASARETIRQVTGEDPKPWFRFPFGESDARTVRIVNGLGFLPIGWTYGSPGYLGTSGGVTVDQVVSRMTATTQPGEILLLHVGSNPDDHTTLDADALPRIIGKLRAAGYSFVSVDTLLR